MLKPIRVRYDSNSNAYNSGWQHHPNYNYTVNTQNSHPSTYNYLSHFHQNRQPQVYQPQQPLPQAVTPCQITTLENLVKAMAITQSQTKQSQIAF